MMSVIFRNTTQKYADLMSFYCSRQRIYLGVVVEVGVNGGGFVVCNLSNELSRLLYPEQYTPPLHVHFVPTLPLDTIDP